MTTTLQIIGLVVLGAIAVVIVIGAIAVAVAMIKAVIEGQDEDQVEVTERIGSTSVTRIESKRGEQ